MRLLLASALGMALIGCSEATGPETWDGVYETATKFDGPDGVWAASADLVIGSDGSVKFGSVTIAGAVFVGDTLSWEVAAGNSASASVVFKESDDRGYYWIAPVDECFTGWIQLPGGEPLDFRGLRM